MADQVNDNNKSNEIEEIQVPVLWDNSEKTSTIYANQLLITHGGKEFYLVFGEVDIPLLLGNPGEVVPDKLMVKPLIKIALTPEVMLDVANAINQNVAKFLSRVKQQEQVQDKE